MVLTKEDFELKLKRQQVQLLSLERRIQSLSEESKFTEGVILEKRREEFSLIDLIRSTHEATDPQAPMELRETPFSWRAIRIFWREFYAISFLFAERKLVDM